MNENYLTYYASHYHNGKLKNGINPSNESKGFGKFPQSPVTVKTESRLADAIAFGFAPIANDCGFIMPLIP